MTLLLRLCYVLSLALLVSSKAVVVRDLPFLNLTTSVTSTRSGTPRLNPHLEISASGFFPEETVLPQSPGSSPTEQDLGGPRSTSDVPKPTNSGGSRARLETTVSRFGDGHSPSPGAITRIVAPTVVLGPVTVHSRVLQPTPVTHIQIGDKTLSPGGDTVTIGTGSSATRVHIDPSGQPVVVVGSSTSTHRISITIGNQVATPIPSGMIVDGQTATKGGPPIIVGPATLSINNAGETISISGGATSTVRSPAIQALTFEGITATVVATDNQYVIGSSTLAPGKPITLDGTAMSLTTDAAGSTVLVAGTLTTTLPAPFMANRYSITTTVISGTTQYLINSQTLKPGHPITVDGTPMSLIIASGTTIFVVGDKTTAAFDPIAIPRPTLTKIIAAETSGSRALMPNPASTSTESSAVKPGILIMRNNLVAVVMIIAIMSIG